MFTEMKNPDDYRTFVLSHIFFTIGDRYSEYRVPFMYVAASLTLEKPLPKMIAKNINPKLHSAIRDTLSNLFEFSLKVFPDANYAEFQKCLDQVVEKLSEDSHGKSVDK